MKFSLESVPELSWFTTRQRPPRQRPSPGRQPLHWDYFTFARHAGTGIRIQPENGALDFGRWNILLA